MILKKFFKTLFSRPERIALHIWNNIAFIIPDKIFLAVKFRLRMGYWMDFCNPITFSEKLQWLKLYDHRREYIQMVDKIEVKKYVANIIGEEYIIPTLAIYNSVDNIDFNALPNQFVLKCTHDSGTIIICKDKSKLDKKEALAKLKRGLTRNYYYQNREWPYKNVPHRIIAEEYIDPSPNRNDLPDYKWYCFDGEPKYCQVIQDRSTKETIDFFDTEWNHQEFVGLNPIVGNAAILPSRPNNLETQLYIAKRLSKSIPFSRIDLYDIGNRIYFGEITFYPLSGMGVFKPNQYNELLGRMIVLPCKNQK